MTNRTPLPHGIKHYAAQMTNSGLLSWVVFVLMVVSSGILTLTTPLPFVSQNPWLRTPISMAAAAVSVGILMLAWASLLRHLAGWTRIVATFAAYIGAGVLKAIVQQALALAFGTAQWDTHEVMVRILTNSTQWPVALAIIVFGVSTTRLYSRRLRLLHAHQQMANEVAAEATTDVEVRQDQLIATVRETISREVNKLRESKPETLITDTEKFVEDTIRPLSHKLAAEVPRWEVPTVDITRVALNWPRYFLDTQIVGALNAWWVTATIVVFSFGFTVATGGLSDAVITYATTTPVILVLFWVAIQLCRIFKVPNPWGQLAMNVVVMFVVGIAPFTFLQYVGIQGWLPEIPGTVSFIFLGPALIALLTVSTACYESQDQVTRLANEVDGRLSWLQARISIERWAKHGQIARVLHGPYQALIYSHILGYQAKFEEGQLTQAEVPKLATSLEQDLDQALQDESDQQSLALALERIVALWSDVVQINVSYTDDAKAMIEPDSALSDLSSSLVHDGIVNAIRHGKATEISIDISQTSPFAVRIMIADNGTELADTGSTGLGSIQFDDNTLAWDLTQLDVGHELRLWLPCGGTDVALELQRDGVEQRA